MKQKKISVNSKLKLDHKIKNLYQGDFGFFIDVDITDYYQPGWKYEMLMTSPTGKAFKSKLYFPNEEYIPETEYEQTVPVPDDVPEIEDNIPEIEDEEVPEVEEEIQPFSLLEEEEIDPEMGVEPQPLKLRWYFTKRMTEEAGWHNIQLRCSMELTTPSLDSSITECAAQTHSHVSVLYINPSLEVDE